MVPIHIGCSAPNESQPRQHNDAVGASMSLCLLRQQKVRQFRIDLLEAGPPACAVIVPAESQAGLVRLRLGLGLSQRFFGGRLALQHLAVGAKEPEQRAAQPLVLAASRRLSEFHPATR